VRHSQTVVVESPGHLGEIEVDSTEEGEDRGSDHHIVEVRDDEVGPLKTTSRTKDERKTPVIPPMMNKMIEPIANNIGTDS